ncbi:ubiquinone biosynthesis accessory factor UbiJ [Alteromonas sp. a30]|uniref:ubiquinone biosynthesis accessory factor UbiJ n=1 Tax=Alteromonas sp. a30 TaxID=2730917 RepID=UPI0022815A0E|nr:SCP2 sterol-binding domain-containing protein [Alteromonas sp. a30]MCY7295351.1 sterol-binding protein [Alteromonas sp. a30]
MPAKQLAGGAIEALLNTIIKLDPISAKRLQPLQDKRLKVSIKELPWPLTFAFSDRVDVLTQVDAAQSTNKLEPSADCHISLQMGTLSELKDSSQITRLIQEKRLDLEGDIHVAQHFSTLVKDLNIDWEEHLSRYVGDVAAHQFFLMAEKAKVRLSHGLQHISTMLKEGAIEEKKLIPHAVEIEQFVSDISSLRGQVGRLEARIEHLVNQAKTQN